MFCILVLPYVVKYMVIDVVHCNQCKPSYGRLQRHNFMYKFSSVHLYLSHVIQTGQLGPGADGSDEEEFPSIEDQSGMGSVSEPSPFGAIYSRRRRRRSLEEEDVSRVDGSSSGAGMSSFFFTNLL